MKRLNTLLLCFLLSGCSAMAALEVIKGLAGDKPGISAEAQVGDRDNNVAAGNTSRIEDIEVEDNATLNLDQSNKETTFSGKADQVTINESSWWQTLALVLSAFLVGLFFPQAKLWNKS